MSAVWDDKALLEPISAEQPCGQNLDEAPILPGTQTAVLSELDGLRLFGQARSPEAPPDPEESERESAKVRPPIEWDRIRNSALDGLKGSKDLRLLAYLGTALLRTDGLPAFGRTMTIASQWLETYWPQVYPLLDEGDAMARACPDMLCGPMAVVDRVWRFRRREPQQAASVFALDIANGAGVARWTETGRRTGDPGSVQGDPDEELTALEQSVVAPGAA